MSERVLELVVRAGELMLKNGAETYRVEETMEWMGKACPGCKVDAIVTPVGLFVTLEEQNGVRLTQVKRVRERTLDLNKIYQIIDCSRDLAKGEISLTEAAARLIEIERQGTLTRHWQRLLAAGIGGACFTKLFGGSWLDFTLAFVASLTVQVVTEGIRPLPMVRFMSDFVGGLTGASVAITGAWLLRSYGFNLDAVVPGAIMTLVPGVAITSSVRDLVAGDLISGTTRGLESIIAAAAIAAGVALALGVYVWVGGWI